MNPKLWRRSKAGPFLRWLPRFKHVRGTWLHRRLGDRLFAQEIWHPDRQRFAGGAAVGGFFAMMPFPFQMLAAAFIAWVTRVNLPAAVVATWVSNPFTIAFFLYGQYRIGAFLLGREVSRHPDGGLWEMISQAPVPILVGAIVSAFIVSGIAYGLTLVGFDLVTRHFMRPRRSGAGGR